MIIDLDTERGKVVVRNAQAILGIVNDLHLTPHEARIIAEDLDSKGEHTVAAEGLRRAADQAETRS
ncbi:hypothetical protein [Mycolicibacterium sp.]|uniref:hypothetical protein n=1 Tax=Mycolicibacterium sp. TaxID=2320850 RepID=UPI00355FB455